MGSLEANPASIFLLGLSQQRASGTLSVGGCTLLIREGRFIGVESAADDETAAGFLRRSHQVSDDVLSDAVSACDGDDGGVLRRLVRTRHLSAESAIGVRRSMLLDRLVRALDRAGSERLPALDPELPAGAADASTDGFALLPLMLDALSRVAAKTDAGLVAKNPQARLQWLPGPFAAEARSWAGLDGIGGEPTITEVLKVSPAVVPSIAAVVRAGIARLQAPALAALPNRAGTGTLPPPAPRLSIIPRAMSPLPPRGTGHGPGARLGPGVARVNAKPIAPTELPPWPARNPDLSDPLREVELDIERMEQDSASGEALATRWTDLADLWERQLCSVTEATRALREAAAVHPQAPHILERAARSCLAIGEYSLAMAYAEAATNVAPDSRRRWQAKNLAAHLAIRGAHSDDGVARLRMLCAEPPADARDTDAFDASHERLFLLLERSTPAEAAQVAARHGRQSTDTRRAAVFLQLALALEPSDADLVRECALALAKSQRPGLAIATLANAAYGQTDPQTAGGLLHHAAVIADEAAQADTAAALLARAYSLCPQDTQIQQRLASALRTLQQPEALAVLQLDMVHTADGAVRRQRLLAAADATDALGTEGEFARLLRRSLEDPAEVDFERLADGMSRRADESADVREQSLLYRRLSALRHATGDLRGTVSAALRCLALAPRDTLAIARLLIAASRLGNSTAMIETLGYAARAAPSERQRGQLLTQLAWWMRLTNRIPEALEHAEAALVCDPHDAEAGALIVACLDSLPATRLRTVLASCLTALPDDITLVRALAWTTVTAPGASIESDADALEHHVRRHTDAWRRLLPRDPAPHLLLLDLALRGDDHRAIRIAAEGALDNLLDPRQATALVAAADRLAALGQLAPATRLLLRLYRTLGTRDPTVADHALDYARLTADDELLTLALEWRAQIAEGPARTCGLEALAEHHRRTNNGAGEIRARIRQLLSEGPGAASTRRLGELLASTGDLRRLLALLSLELQTAPSEELRNRVRIRMAQAIMELSTDPETLLSHLADWATEEADNQPSVRALVSFLMAIHPDDLRAGIALGRRLAERVPEPAAGWIDLWLARTAELTLTDDALALDICTATAPRHPLRPELMLLVERITLESGDVETAMRVYDELSAKAAGQHGRRALLYRAGRWLELAGHPKQALARFADALALAPNAGAVLDAMERVGRANDNLGPAAEAYLELGRAAPDDAVRRHCLEKVLELCEEDRLDGRLEFGALRALGQLEPRPEIDEALIACLDRLGTSDHEIGQQATAALTRDWQARLEQTWEPEQEVRMLRAMAALSLRSPDDHDGALPLLEKALGIVENRGLGTDLHADILCARAEYFQRAGEQRLAISDVRAALRVSPGHEQGRKLASQLLPDGVRSPTSSTPPAPAAEATAATSAKPAERPPQVAPRRSTASFARPPQVDHEHASLAPKSSLPPEEGKTGRTTPGVQAPDDSTSEVGLRHATEGGDPDALEGLARYLEGQPDGLPEALHCYTRLCRQEPSRTDALRGLNRTASMLGAGALAHVSSQLLALFDSSFTAPTALQLDHRRLSVEELQTLLDGDSDSQLFDLLAMAFEGARALHGFHKELAFYEVTDRDQVSALDAGPIARALLDATTILRSEQTELYLKKQDTPELGVAARLPATIIATTAIGNVPGLRSSLAKAVVASQPRHLLLNALPPKDAGVVLEGLVGAFGPTKRFGSLSREGKTAAAALWDGIPKRDQASARELVTRHANALTYRKLRRWSELAQLRGALLVSADAAEVLSTLVDPARLAAETEFQQVCRSEQAVADVIRLALGEDHLAALTQSMLD